MASLSCRVAHTLKYSKSLTSRSLTHVFVFIYNLQIYYEGALQGGEVEKKKGEDGEVAKDAARKPAYEGHEAYEKLCRGEVTLSEAYKAKLKCR